MPEVDFMLRQRLKNLILAAVLLATLASPSYGNWPFDGQLVDQASEFLTLLDQGLYLEAWAETSPNFQGLTNKQEWLSRQQLIRSAYGPLIFRELYHTGFRGTYEHSPDSQYIVIQFSSTFSNKAIARETIVYDCSPDSSSCRVRDYILQ
jgi:hypothetical protein